MKGGIGIGIEIEIEWMGLEGCLDVEKEAQMRAAWTVGQDAHDEDARVASRTGYQELQSLNLWFCSVLFRFLLSENGKRIHVQGLLRDADDVWRGRDEGVH